MPAKKLPAAKLDPSKIHIADVEILHAELNSTLGFDPDLIEKYEVENNLDLAFNLDEGMTKAELKLSIQSISQVGSNQQEITAEFHLVFLFHVENLKELTVVSTDNTLNLKGGLGNAISSITYSTSRGILLTRFQGTSFSKFILPIIDPNNLL